MSYFSDLGLAEPLLRALETKGYADPTPIQKQAIPALLQGRDLLGIAQTGTGKTAAFSLPSLHRLAADPKPRQNAGCRMLVLSPTRELAAQIAENNACSAGFPSASRPARWLAAPTCWSPPRGACST
jgi:ATP-dependent RNA helicase RhlE